MDLHDHVRDKVSISKLGFRGACSTTSGYYPWKNSIRGQFFLKGHFASTDLCRHESHDLYHLNRIELSAAGL